jgi:hypothetical protein
MFTQRRFAVVALTCGVIAMTAAIAIGAGNSSLSGQVGGKSKLHLKLRVQQGQAVVKKMSWKGLKCAGMKFDGNAEGPFYVNKHGKFKTTNGGVPTAGPVDGPPYLATIKGTLTDDFKKASGTLRVKGGQPTLDCDTGKLDWKVHAH